MQPFQGMTPQRIAFTVDLAGLTRPERRSRATQARSIQKRFAKMIATEKAFQVAAAIFGTIAMALESQTPRRTHDVEMTYIAADHTTSMLRGEAQKAMRALNDPWWSRVADALAGQSN